MHAHDGYEPHSHEVLADHMGVHRTEGAVSDRHALDHIAELLARPEWDGADMLMEIDAVVRGTGRNQEGG
jgi:hypothetical protein